jgi:ribosomal protein S16
LSKGNTRFMEKLGYYNTDPFHKIISINGRRLGFWLNRGASLNLSVYKIFRKFLAKSN